MRRAACVLVTVLAMSAGCGGADDGPIDATSDGAGRDCTPVIGDPSRPIEVRPVYVSEAGPVVPLGADGAVGLLPPIQGGYVLMVGLEARNVRGCSATITGVIRDPDSREEFGRDERPSQLVVGDDGWGRLGFPAFATSANLQTCPGAFGRDFDGNSWALELVLSDAPGRSARWSGPVVPFCDPQGRDPAACACQCDSDFEFGQPCPVDGAAPSPVR